MARLGKVPKRKGNKDPTTSVSVSSEKTDKILMCGVALLCLSVAGLVCDAMLLIVMPSLCVFAVAGVVGNAMLIDHAFQRNEKGPGTLLILQIIGNAMLIIFTLQRPGSGPGISAMLLIVIAWFFVFLYLLYYMASRWDGSRRFKLALGIPISVLIVFIIVWRAFRGPL